MSAPLDEQDVPRTPVETEVYTGPDRRSARRVDCHTVVTALSPGTVDPQARPQCYKVYSEDISTSGARLFATEPLPSKRLYLHFLLPGFGDRYVQAEVVGCKRRDRHSLTGHVTLQYVYSVRFSGIVCGEEMRRALSANAGPAPASAGPSPSAPSPSTPIARAERPSSASDPAGEPSATRRQERE